MNLKGSETEKNLLRTFAAKSRTRNKYSFYAERAKMEGHEYIASIFNELAENEKVHAKEIYKRYLDAVNNTTNNLKEAEEAEKLESVNIYREFARIAKEEGFIEIEKFYKELSEVDKQHMITIMKTRYHLEDEKRGKRNLESTWKCMNCGYMHLGVNSPNICPLCKSPRSYFKTV